MAAEEGSMSPTRMLAEGHLRVATGGGAPADGGIAVRHLPHHHPSKKELVIMAWKLEEVPSDPTPSHRKSTVDVVAAKIDPKLANTLIRELSKVCPLDNLRHVKRVRRQTECDGKPDLSVILCLSTASETCSNDFPEDMQKIVDSYQLRPFTAKFLSGCQILCYIKKGMGRTVQTVANILSSCTRVFQAIVTQGDWLLDCDGDYTQRLKACGGTWS